MMIGMGSRRLMAVTIQRFPGHPSPSLRDF